MLDRALGLTKLPLKDLRAVVRFGSRVYGTHGTDSDHDLLVVTSGALDGREFRAGDLNLHVQSEARFRGHVAAHKVRALECLWAPPAHVLHGALPPAQAPDPAAVRASFVEKSDDSWALAQKLVGGQDHARGLKSLFHALRILTFAHDIARHGRLTGYQAANGIWEEMAADALSGPASWDTLAARWAPERTKLMATIGQEKGGAGRDRAR